MLKKLSKVQKLEEQIFSTKNLNRAVNKLKKKYYSDLVDKFPVGYDKERFEDLLKVRDQRLIKIRKELLGGKYKFSPFLERRIPKNHKKYLVLCQGCLHDVIVQIAINQILNKRMQSVFPKGLYSGRIRGSHYNVHQLVRKVYKFHKDKKFSAVKLDVEDYFNQINRRILESQIDELLGSDSSLKKIIVSYINAKRVSKGRVTQTRKGIPIGSHLAALLSNIYLMPFDRLVQKKVIFYARYADDIFIIVRERIKAEGIVSLIRSELKKYSLKINEDKLHLIKPGEGFEYLGYEFRDGNIYIRKKSIKKFQTKVKLLIRKRKMVKIRNTAALDEKSRVKLIQLIEDLNRLICGTGLKGWTRYFARVSFSKQFRELDIWLREKLRQKLTGSWSKKNYRKFKNEFFKDLGLKSLVREYYGWHERWQEYSKPLINRISSMTNLEKALEYYLSRRNLENDEEVQEFLADRRRNLEEMHTELLEGKYKFSIPKKKEIKRFDTKEKRFVYTSNFPDRVVQRAIINIIQPFFDDKLSENVFSYRKGSSIFKGVSQLIRTLRCVKGRTIIRSDFENFHQSVNLQILKNKVHKLMNKYPKVINIFDAFFCSLSSVEFLPKGMPITNFLLNVYLKGFDEAVSQCLDNYLRYADDFIVISQATFKDGEARSFIENEGSKLDLKLKPSKTKFVSFGDTFSFLGYRFSIGKELRIGLSEFTIHKLKRKIKRLTMKRKFHEVNIKNYESSKDIERLIKQINYFFSTRKKTSWSKYFCRVNDFDELKEIDMWIEDRLRLCITKRMRLKDRRKIPHSTIKKMGLVSCVSWISRAKGLMYNNIAYQNPELR
ncbi:hypothetical protein JW766_01450 [Candidatus Dojkabacteria bacterium]|nr:hypothetical protein [Candidatus Dojkabacteria bacterium]